MWILGINIGHNGSTALFKDKELIFYIEEERLSREKYDGNPYLGMAKAYEYTDHIDHLVICATDNNFGALRWNNENPYSIFIRKMQPKIPFELHAYGDFHHATHAFTAFYNSGFDRAACIVVDGAGSGSPGFDGTIKDQSWEVESVWSMEYPSNIVCHLKHYGWNNPNGFTLDEGGAAVEISDSHGIVKSYEAVTRFLGFHPIEAGKTMGLAPYGKPNDQLEPISVGKFNNRNFIKPGFPAGNVLRVDLNPSLSQQDGSTDWHTDPSLVTDEQRDLAYAVQKSSEQRVIEIIRYAVETTGMKKIVVSGGYGLNCVANYEYLKAFPDVEFYVEPISHDGGNVVGACLFTYYSTTGDQEPYKISSLYLGPEPKYVDLYVEGIEIKDSSVESVAKLLAENNIVAIFQGRSEAGPRALGNRSILFNPTVPDGKDIVNRVKRREWFRPFAGSVLKEKASDWFDLKTLDESPFMMYAVDVKEDKRDQIPSITHVDGTCRVQTVTEEQNKHYYQLIKEFETLTSIPVLFNTSFNLAGDPLIENVKEAVECLKNSEIEYLWLPEIGKLVVCKN